MELEAGGANMRSMMSSLALGFIACRQLHKTRTASGSSQS
jgi:hypothetical protein